MAKDPAFLFYSSDFLTGTAFFTNYQVGAYIRILCHMHQSGRLSEKQMMIICGGVDDDVFSKFKRDENGLFYNERLENEINKRKAHSEKQREKVKKRWEKSDTVVLPRYESGNTVVLPLENENENIIVIDNVSVNSSSNIDNKAKKAKKQKREFTDPNDPELLEAMQAAGKRPCTKIGAPWVFLSENNYIELCKAYPNEQLRTEMIIEYSKWKEGKGKISVSDRDIAGIKKSWVEVNALKVLNARSMPITHKMQQQEAIKSKFITE